MKVTEVVKTNTQSLVEAIAAENTTGISNELLAEVVEVAANANTEWTTHSAEEMMARYN
jgi:hypothetical protein